MVNFSHLVKYGKILPSKQFPEPYFFLLPYSPLCSWNKETLIKVTCSNPIILKYGCSRFEDFNWTIRWQSSIEAETGKFQNDSSKNIHSPFVLLPSPCSDTSALTHCLYLSDYCFKGFPRQGVFMVSFVPESLVEKDSSQFLLISHSHC